MLEAVLKKVKGLWVDRNMGIHVGWGSWLTNLRFADDIMLLAASQDMMMTMLQDLKKNGNDSWFEHTYG